VLALVVLVVAAALLASSCSDAHTSDEKLKAEAGTDPRVITVFQPPELIPAMKALATAFGRDHPDVAFTYDDLSSSSQRKRVDDGATPSIWIDVAQTIDPYAKDSRSQGDPLALGSNVLQFIVQPGNPKRITTLPVFGPDGGPVPGARTGLCKADTRCGSSSGKLLVQQKIDATPTMRTPDSDALAAAVVADTLDTGLVWRTSSAPLGAKLTLVPLDNPATGLVDYHMLRFTVSTTAAEFETFLGTDEAKSILLTQGLLPEIKAS
jgi:ABC-type molybdate transport system substrate-binding protein